MNRRLASPVGRTIIAVAAAGLASCTHLRPMLDEAEMAMQQISQEVLQLIETDRVSPPDRPSSRPQRVSAARIFVIGNHPNLTGFVAKSLSARGFNVVGQRHHPGFISKRQVRYFHRVDRSAARKLAEAFDAELKDFTSYRPKPPQGNIEFWPETDPKPK